MVAAHFIYLVDDHILGAEFVEVVLIPIVLLKHSRIFELLLVHVQVLIVNVVLQLWMLQGVARDLNRLH